MILMVTSQALLPEGMMLTSQLGRHTTQDRMYLANVEDSCTIRKGIYATEANIACTRGNPQACINAGSKSSIPPEIRACLKLLPQLTFSQEVFGYGGGRSRFDHGSTFLLWHKEDNIEGLGHL